MNTKEIFEETGRLGNEIKKLNKELQQINNKCIEMMNVCPHEIVFKYHDNHPRKLVMDGTYFCPACGKGISCINKNQIKSTCFKDARIIPLDNLSLLGTKETLAALRYEVYLNMDLYYNLDVDTVFLTDKMEDVLKDYEHDYFRERVLIKSRFK